MNPAAAAAVRVIDVRVGSYWLLDPVAGNLVNKIVPPVAHDLVALVCWVNAILEIAGLKRGEVHGQYMVAIVVALLHDAGDQLLILLGPPRLIRAAGIYNDSDKYRRIWAFFDHLIDQFAQAISCLRGVISLFRDAGVRIHVVGPRGQQNDVWALFERWANMIGDVVNSLSGPGSLVGFVRSSWLIRE